MKSRGGYTGIQNAKYAIILIKRCKLTLLPSKVGVLSRNIEIPGFKPRKLASASAVVSTYRKIPKISPGAVYFSKALFEGPIFGGAYIQRGLSTEGNLRFKIDWASLVVGSKFTTPDLLFLLCFTLYLRAIFQVQALGELIFGGAI